MSSKEAGLPNFWTIDENNPNKICCTICSAWYPRSIWIFRKYRIDHERCQRHQRSVSLMKLHDATGMGITKSRPTSTLDSESGTTNQSVRNSEAFLKLKPTYVISTALNIHIEAYVWRLALCPYLRKFKASWGPLLLPAMREAGSNQFQLPKNEEDIAIIYSKIDETAKKVQSTIQEILALSLGFSGKNSRPTKPDGPSCHLTTVARVLVGQGPDRVAITTEFMQRLALLRAFCLDHNDMSTKDDFWTYVDHELEKYSKRYKDKPVEYEEWREDVLALDLNDYPRPNFGFKIPDIRIVSYGEVSYVQKVVDNHVLLEWKSNML